MRILHIGKYYHPHRGGMETALRVMAEGLSARGAAVSVLVAGGVRGGGGAQEIGGVRVVRAWTPALVNSQPLTPGLVALLQKELAAFAPDVVTLHLPNPLGAAAWLLAGAGRQARRPALAVWHHADITRQRLGRLAVAPVQGACLRRAAAVAVSSEALRSGSRELAGCRARTTVIPFGIDGAWWDAGGGGAGTGPFLFVGRLVSYKGLGVLLKALAELPSGRLVVVGEGPEGDALRRLAQELGIAGRVTWAGSVGDEALRALLGEARALVLPSVDTSETFGLVQLEAMAAGVPVVASDLPTGVREVASPESHLLVPPGDAPALSRALGRLLDQPELGRDLGRGGRLRQRALFSRELMTDRLVHWFDAALAARRE